MWGALEAGLAVGVCITLVAVLSACVCGCRKPNPKSEFIGTPGVVKLHGDDEESNAADNTPLSAKRVSAQNSQRSLPEIPVPVLVPRQDSGDTASELYATVGLDQRPPSQSPKVVTRDHPYEHAYAILQEGIHRNEEPVPIATQALQTSSVLETITTTTAEIQSNPESVVISASIAISGQLPSSQELPYITPPATVSAPVLPPVVAPTDVQVANLRTDQTQHFSGDSTDSTKGYTSISVREPLSSIRANIGSSQLQPHYATVSDDSDEMYAAIDEPSNLAYTSGSETYAQIQPTVQTVQPILHAPPQPILKNCLPEQNIVDHSNGEGPSHSRASHSVAEKPEANQRWSMTTDPHLPTAASHSRQESSSSGTNSMGALGSPKPEKRQANSPLPPPPSTSLDMRKSHDSPLHHANVSSRQQRISSTGDLNSNHDKLRRSLNEKHQRNNSCVSSSDFYGCNYPVDKHRFSSGDLGRPLVARELNFDLDTNTYSNIDAMNDTVYNIIGDDTTTCDVHVAPQHLNVSAKLSPIKNLEEMYAKVIKKGKHLVAQENRSQVSSRLSNYDDVDSVFKLSSEARTVNIHDEDMYSVLNEAALNHNTNVDDGVNRLKIDKSADREDPGYETIDRMRNKSHGYEIINKNNAKVRGDKFSDPGYETVKEPYGHTDMHHPQPADLLLRVGHMKDLRHDSFGPESLLSSDPGYEHILRSENCASDSDPNYEVLRLNPPTPPYASIQNFSHNRPVYSSINKKCGNASDMIWLTNNDFSLSEPNYESMPHESAYNAGSESDPNYESVGPKDPNYESVKYFEAAIREPPYDKVQSNLSGENRLSRRSSSGYERIKTKPDHAGDGRTVNGSRANTADNAVVSDYFQV